MKFGVGQAVRRKEDQRFVTGAGCYLDDITLPGEAHVAILRSPHAHAAIRRIDTRRASAAPGVVAVLTGADAEADKVPRIPCVTQIVPDMIDPVRPVLARDRVRHVGDMVAAVVAETPLAARDALELIEVDYEPLPAVAGIRQAVAPGAPLVWPEAPGNRSFVWRDGDAEQTDAAFATAARRASIELVNNRVVPNSMEPRGMLVQHDAADDSYTLWISSQGPHLVKDAILGAILPGHPPEKLRVVSRDVGGGFGMKLFLYPEYVLGIWAAKRVGRPLKWIEDRSEAFLADVHGRDNVTSAELAMDAAGRFLALRVKTLANMGGYLSMFGPYIPTLAGQGMYVGVYGFAAASIEVHGIFTNTVPVDAYRGAGRPEAAYLIERLVNEAAKTMGMSPAEIRRINFIPPEAFPAKTPLGHTYDSGDFARIMDLALARADVAGGAARKAEALARGRLRGIGMSYYVECCGGAPGIPAVARFEADGTVTLIVGTLSNGQGHETAYSQIAAERLGVDFESIRVVQGDTALLAAGSFTGGSRSVTVGGVATRGACDAAIRLGMAAASDLLETSAADITFVDGRYVVAGTDRAVGIVEVARNLLERTGKPLQGDAEFAPDAPTYPNGCHVCELEIDRDTGTVEILRYTVVDDFGEVVNPMLLAGQVHGGIAQGIGQALIEETRYAEDGQLLTGSFMDYAMPRAGNLPNYETGWEAVRCRTNPMGIKGCAEAGTIGAPPAVMHAVIDALAPLGIADMQMPATPQRIWAAIEAAGG